MRKFTLILMFVAFTGFVFAQKTQKQHALTASDRTIVVESMDVKAGGDILYTEDFDGSLPDDWTNVDLSGECMPWFWTADSVFGKYTRGYIESPTADNGFMTMNADGYNTIPQFAGPDEGEMVPNPLDVDAYIQAPEQDFSAQIGVVVELHQQYRYFTGMRYDVDVSNDYDPENPGLAHWDSYQLNINAAINAPNQDEHFEINVSATAAGYSSVYIRFHAYGSSHYFWNVDDIAITVPYNNDMVLTDTWAFYAWETEPPEGSVLIPGYMQHGGFYESIPIDQVQPFVGFRGSVENFGLNDQTNVKMTTTVSRKATLDGEMAVIETFETNAINVNAADIDSVYGAVDFTPENYGWYSLDMNVTMDNVEELPDNNIDHWGFVVNDSTYARCPDSVTASVSTRGYIDGGYDDDGLGTVFTLTEVTEVFGLKWYISKYNTDNYMEEILDGDYTYFARMKRWDEEANNWSSSNIISSEIQWVQPKDTGVWLYTEFVKDGNVEFFAPGDYLAYLNTSTGNGPGTNENRYYFRIGADLTVPQPDATAWLYRSFVGDWTWINANLSIKLVIGADDWIGDSTTTNIVIYQEINICEGDSVFLQGDYQYEAGEYFDTIFVEEGLDTIYITDLFVNGPPLIYGDIMGQQNICLCPSTSESYYYISDIYDFNSINWSLYPGEAGILSEDNQSVFITWSQLYQGQATLIFEAINECGSAMDSILINIEGLTYVDTINVVIMEEFTDIILLGGQEININIYPNPGESFITIEISPTIINKLEIFNEAGTLVETLEPNDNSTELDISTYEDGIYIIKIYNSNNEVMSAPMMISR